MQNTAAYLERVVTIANGKGGVGKTSFAVNLAGEAAAAGWRVLLVDFDPQGNAGEDLGYVDDDANDHGQHLVDAILGREALAPVLTNVRDGLDVIPGGEVLDDLEALLVGRSMKATETKGAFANVLVPIAGDYDLIIIDTPPTRPVLLQQVLTASRWVLIPTRSDRASIRGLAALANQISAARADGAVAQILGTVLFAVTSSAKNVKRNALADITEVLSEERDAYVFETTIRYVEAAAVQAREDGKLVAELAADVEGAEPYYKALKEGRTPERLPGSAPSLAGDYIMLAKEMLDRLTSLLEQQASA